MQKTLDRSENDLLFLNLLFLFYIFRKIQEEKLQKEPRAHRRPRVSKISSTIEDWVNHTAESIGLSDDDEEIGTPMWEGFWSPAMITTTLGDISTIVLVAGRADFSDEVVEEERRLWKEQARTMSAITMSTNIIAKLPKR